MLLELLLDFSLKTLSRLKIKMPPKKSAKSSKTPKAQASPGPAPLPVVDQPAGDAGPQGAAGGPGEGIPSASGSRGVRSSWTFSEHFRTNEQRLAFVSSFRSKPFLYDKSCQQYKDTTVKEEGKAALCLEFGLTPDQLKKCIKHMWDMVRSSKQRLEAAQEAGGTEDPFAGAEQARWWWHQIAWLAPYRGEPRKKHTMGCVASHPAPAEASATAPPASSSPALSAPQPATQVLGAGTVAPVASSSQSVQEGTGSVAAASTSSAVAACGCPVGCCDTLRDHLLENRTQLVDPHRNFMTWLMTESNFLQGFQRSAFHARMASLLMRYMPPGEALGPIPSSADFVAVDGGFFVPSVGFTTGPALSRAPATVPSPTPSSSVPLEPQVVVRTPRRSSRKGTPTKRPSSSTASPSPSKASTSTQPAATCSPSPSDEPTFTTLQPMDQSDFTEGYASLMQFLVDDKE